MLVSVLVCMFQMNSVTECELPNGTVSRIQFVSGLYLMCVGLPLTLRAIRKSVWVSLVKRIEGNWYLFVVVAMLSSNVPWFTDGSTSHFPFIAMEHVMLPFSDVKLRWLLQDLWDSYIKEMYTWELSRSSLDSTQVLIVRSISTMCHFYIIRMCTPDVEIKVLYLFASE